MRANVFADMDDSGVDWSPRFGAVCLFCGHASRKHKWTRVMRWNGPSRTRYHCCEACGGRFKSIEFDITAAVSAGYLHTCGIKGAPETPMALCEN